MPNSKFRCPGCKTHYPHSQKERVGRKYFHAKECGLKWAAEQGAKKAEKARQAREKARRKKTREAKKRLKTRAQWYAMLQKLVNQWVVHVRDKYKPCYTCGTVKPDIKYDAGHRYHAGSGGGDRRRFIPENIHKQCSMACNQHGGGMPAEYDKALIEEYGLGFVEYLESVTNYPTLKEQFPTIEDIENEIKRYRALIREAGLKPCT